MSKQSNILLGVLGAAAAGLAIGLLIAPDKGSETRSRLKKTAGGWVDELGHLFVRAKEETNDLKDKANQARSTAEDKVNKMKDHLS